MPAIQKFEQLKELNLENNYLNALPDNLHEILPNIENLNLNGNDFDDSVSFTFIFLTPNLYYLKF